MKGRNVELQNCPCLTRPATNTAPTVERWESVPEQIQEGHTECRWWLNSNRAAAASSLRGRRISRPRGDTVMEESGEEKGDGEGREFWASYNRREGDRDHCQVAELTVMVTDTLYPHLCLHPASQHHLTSFPGAWLFRHPCGFAGAAVARGNIIGQSKEDVELVELKALVLSRQALSGPLTTPERSARSNKNMK
ncbi:hypothetical protein AAFF_G00098330 [Aldrovandia affinis]|uniref:Uncharacterized protein n=1 Tax=Aldrovandia affinis TaxID=143900 RepID=A0AAD7WBT0_9TELE|nr:hypothetical protein AAFF_G00098330 [Aldrovandia affinis]